MNLTKFTLPAVLFLLTISSGFWVAKSGKPYNTAVFTLHKLIALGMTIFATIAVVNVLKVTQIQPVVILLFVLAGLSILALFATGALMSAQKLAGNAWLLIHRVAPFLLAGSVTAAIFLVFKK
jgi:hypothetical protein